MSGAVWTDAQDDALRETGGRYQAMAQLSRKWGRSTRHLIARWHLLRAKQGRRRG